MFYQPPDYSPTVAAKNNSGVLVTYERGNVTAGPIQRLQITASTTGSSMVLRRDLA
jgi:hypothetical protein